MKIIAKSRSQNSIFVIKNIYKIIMSYKPNQSFNEWNRMLEEIYDKTQNYSKSAYEIHCHLTEVTGGFGKYFIKKKDFKKGEEFLPSIFAWGLSLIRKVTDKQGKLTEVDRLIYQKIPGRCPYCLKIPCECNVATGEKNSSNLNNLPRYVLEYTKNHRDERISDIQMMLTKIYSNTWNRYKIERDKEEKRQELQRKKGETVTDELIKLSSSQQIAYYNISFLYARMVEELAEVAETIRLYHLYKSNFENEIADFFAWFFAIVSSYHELYAEPEKNKIDIESLLWDAYPGVCFFCNMPNCVCRPGPVRELISKPIPEEYENYDEDTQTENLKRLRDHVITIEGMGDLQKNIFPISSIKISVTNYSDIKREKEAYSQFLRDVASVLRKRIRYDKDKFYRKADDELFLLCYDTSSKEAEGYKERIEKLIAEKNIAEIHKPIVFKIEADTFYTLTELQNHIK